MLHLYTPFGYSPRWIFLLHWSVGLLAMTHSESEGQYVCFSSIVCHSIQRNVSPIVCALLMDIYIVLLSFLLFPFSLLLTLYRFSSIQYHTVLSLWSFVFPFSSPASLKALPTSRYSAYNLEFLFSGILDVNSATLMHWLLITAFLQLSDFQESSAKKSHCMQTAPVCMYVQ